MTANNTNTASASLSMIKGSAQKMNLIAGLIRGKAVDVALDNLETCEKRKSFDFKKLLNSAIANAENNHGLDADDLFVKEVNVGKAMTLKRVKARARGRAFRVHKHFSKLSITLAEKEATK